MCSERSNRTADLGGPTRTCCVCRKKGLRSALLRLVFSKTDAEGERLRVSADLRGTGVGRGVYVHPQAACCSRFVEHCRRSVKGRKLENVLSVRELLELNLREIQEGFSARAKAPRGAMEAVAFGAELLRILSVESGAPTNRKIRL